MTFCAERLLTEQAFHALARERGLAPFLAEKFAPVAARRLNRRTRLETRWNGAETVKSAEAGAWVLTALKVDGAPLRDAAGDLNQYAVGPSGFQRDYRPGAASRVALLPWGRVHLPTRRVTALLLEDGFDILAPWGERQRADRGYLILAGGEVYGNHSETFEATYRAVVDASPGDPSPR